MARSERLLELIQMLRRHRRPVSGQTLSEELGVSLRTVYRDIQTLIGHGAMIEGEAGVGYVLRPGFVLPPLMFSDEEIEALVLGARWVAQQTDDSLGRAAANALAKIAAVLPDDMREDIAGTGLLAGPPPELEPEQIDLVPIRQAIRAERKLILHYRDRKGERSRRTVWPIALGFFEQARVLAAWCELRKDYRHFRADALSRCKRPTSAIPGGAVRCCGSGAKSKAFPSKSSGLHNADRNCQHVVASWAGPRAKEHPMRRYSYETDTAVAAAERRL